MSGKHRTFIAIDISKAGAELLQKIQRQLDKSGAIVRWTQRQNLHITLKFLGDVTDAQFSDICRAVANVAADYQRFEYDIEKVSAIPSSGQLRMIWAEVASSDKKLQTLFKKLESTLAELGFKPEARKFKAHITLGRVKSAQNREQLRKLTSEIPSPVLESQRAAGITVYTSNLTPNGPIYTPATRCSFQS